MNIENILNVAMGVVVANLIMTIVKKVVKIIKQKLNSNAK